MLTILVLLLIAWLGVATQFVVQRRREGRAESSVEYFRQQLSTLERATPGSTMSKPLTTSTTTVRIEEPVRPVVDVRRRRREVLGGLAGLVVISLLLRIVASGALPTLLLLVSLAAFGTYVWALWNLQNTARSREAIRRSQESPAVPEFTILRGGRVDDRVDDERVLMTAGFHHESAAN